MRITKRNLKKAAPENVSRLTRWLRIRMIDEMSHSQLIRLLDWLFKRPEKHLKGLTSPW